MTLKLEGMLNLMGRLDLVADGGKVTATGAEVLVEIPTGVQPPHSSAGVPVILPPPPGVPTNPGPMVWIFKSFNPTITVSQVPAIALGVHMQGNPIPPPQWPGLVQPSSLNPGVKANGVPINVVGDQGTTLPNGGPVTYTTSGQR